MRDCRLLLGGSRAVAAAAVTRAYEDSPARTSATLALHARKVHDASDTAQRFFRTLGGTMTRFFAIPASGRGAIFRDVVFVDHTDGTRAVGQDATRAISCRQ